MINNFYQNLFLFSLWLYLFAVVFSAARKIWVRIPSKFGINSFITAFTVHSAALVSYSVSTGQPPLTGLHEYLSVLAWFASGVFIFFIPAETKKLSIEYISPFAFMIMAASELLYSPSTGAMMPALKSYWLIIHVSMAAAAEGCFLVSFVFSLIVLFSKAGSNSESGINSQAADSLAYKFAAAGYPLFTIGALFAGAVWAFQAWGRFWGWDPKETSAFIVWLSYTFYLHAWKNHNIKGQKAALINIAAFVLTLLTIFSSMIFGGLHSYN
ncbi:MAG: cytochrome c biogenesis protein [Fibrobacterota bacterium]